RGGDHRQHQQQRQKTQHHRPAARATHKHQGVVDPHREDGDFQRRRGPPVVFQDFQTRLFLRARTASLILNACKVSATSWVRIIRTPASAARHAQASAAGRRSLTPGPSNFPMNDLRETPRSTGRFKFVKHSSPPSNCKLCSNVLPNPIPGSNTTWTAFIPARFKRSSRSAKKSRTSRTTSL